METTSPTRLRVLISYGHDEHAAVAHALERDLKARGHEVWLDTSYLRPGVDWEAAIEQGLGWVAAEPQRGFVVFLMTPHSARRPDGYCLNELAFALSRRIPIVPVMLVDVEPPLSICRRQWLDLRDCLPLDERRERYQGKLPMLIRALEQPSLHLEGEQARLLRALRPIFYEQDIDHYLPRFTGRRWLFKKIEAWMADPEGATVLWICGGPGSGKSALAAWLCSHYRELAAVHFCQRSSKLKADPGQAVRSLAWQLTTQLSDYLQRLLNLPNLEETCAVGDAATLFDALIVQPMHSLPAPGRTVVMLIDALDEATDGGRNELAEFVAEEAPKLPPWLRLLLTSRPEIEVTQSLQHLDPVMLSAESAENTADVIEYMKTQIAPYAPGGELPAATLALLLETSERNWLYLTLLRDELAAGRLSLSQAGAFPRGLGAVYIRFFLRMFPAVDDYKARVRPFLELVVAACEPLPLDCAARLLRWSAYDTREIPGAFGALLSTAGGVRFFHHTVAEWLQSAESAGVYAVLPQEGQRALAEQGWAEYQRGVDALSDYMQRWLPAHLAAVQRSEDLLRCVTDARFIAAAYRGRQHLELARYWGAADTAAFQARCDQSLQELVTAPGQEERAAEAARALGQLFLHCGVYAQARRCFARYLALASARGEGDAIAFAHLDIGWCARHAEEFDEALAQVDQAIAGFQASHNKGGLGRAESIKGICLWHQQDDLAALEHLELARALCAELDDRRGEAEALNHIGIVCRGLGQYPRALACLHQAEGFYAKVKDQQGLGKCYNSLGTAYWWSGDFDRALDYYQRADQCNARIRQPYIAGLTANNLGYVHLERKEYQRAYEAFARARGIRAQLHIEGYEMMDVSGMALARHYLGDAAAARRLSRQAIEGLGRHRVVEDLTRAYYNHYVILRDGSAEERAEAERALTRARALMDERLQRISDPQVRSGLVQRVPVLRDLQATAT